MPSDPSPPTRDRAQPRAGTERVFGSIEQDGFCIDRHDYRRFEPTDWAAGFEPGTVEICLNHSGTGRLQRAGCQLEFSDASIGHFRIADQSQKAPDGEHPQCSAIRMARQHHRFLSLRFSVAFLQSRLDPFRKDLLTEFESAVYGDPSAGQPPAREISARPMRQRERDIYSALTEPRSSAPAADALYFPSKVMELISTTYFRAPSELDEFFCARQKRIAGQRVERVRAMLADALDEPPSLEEMGRATGCSPFYLSRIFSEATGVTISRYLRRLRIEKAADLLESGRFNVSEAAIEVGYRSLSHFSKAFREEKGVFPSQYRG